MKRMVSNQIILEVRTPELRALAREAKGREHCMTPAQFRLLDPRHRHFLSPVEFIDEGEGKRVDDAFIACNVFIKLIGSLKVLKVIMDVHFQRLDGVLTDDDLLTLATPYEERPETVPMAGLDELQWT